MDFQLTENRSRSTTWRATSSRATATRSASSTSRPGTERFDRVLHRDLADSGILGLLVPEEHGGAGLGLWEVAGVFVEQGRTLGTVPLWETLVGGVLPLVRYGDARQQARVAAPRRRRRRGPHRGRRRPGRRPAVRRPRPRAVRRRARR